MNETLELIALGIEKRNICLDKDKRLVVRANINWSGKLSKGKIPVKIHSLYGSFDVSHNELNSLENCPDFVGGTFSCNATRIKNFKGGPRFVHILNAVNIPTLESLDYAPCSRMKVLGGFDKTQIGTEEIAFYELANKAGTWNSDFTFEDNVKFTCMEYPEVFANNWSILEEYRSAGSESRGRSAGINTGIL